VGYRQLIKQVEGLVGDIEAAEEAGGTIHVLVDAIIQRFRGALGIYGGRLYRRQEDRYELVATFPDARPVAGVWVSATYPPIEAVLDEGVVFMTPDDPRLDREFEASLGVEDFAAIEVGDGEFLLSFNLEPGTHREEILYSLGVIRHAINQKLRQVRFEAVFEEARKIQASILPRRVPRYGDFDFFGRTETMERVGGDFYDFIPLTDKILGIAIADVSGHGLPAALQVRDVYTGLRMGLARDFKIVRTVERLNQIIHRSTLTSRFVSMFYGELELAGIFIYVNAGHPPPFLLPAKGSVRFLEEGGAVLGPVAEATYERGFVRMEPGDILVLYTDGLSEARSPGSPERPQGEEFGVERLVATVEACRGQSAAAIGERLLAEVSAFTGNAPPHDDRTVVVITRTGIPQGS
jgi:sigma-B regulation protein RsbU (phosphoserine phosphatase)